MPHIKVRSGRMADWGRRASSIRFSIVLLAIIAVVPLLVDRVRLMETDRADRIAAAAAQAQAFARAGVDKQEDVLIAARSVLQTLGHAVERVPAAGPQCNRFLADVASDVPWARAISFVSPAGQITCSSNRQAIGLDVADRPYFRNAVASDVPAVSGFLLPRAQSQPVIIAAYATRDASRNVQAVINILVDLQWLGQLANVVHQRGDALVLLVDQDGTVLAGHPHRDAWVGRELHTHALMREVQSRSAGTVTAAGFDGIRRIWGFQPIANTGAHLLVGLDERAVVSRVEGDMRFAYLQLAFVVALVLLAAWFFGEHAILKPIHRLTRFAVHVGRGDLSVRTARKEWANEFAPLARALDGMADRLAAREHSLRVETDHFRQLASLDALTGLPNRRRFDAHMAAEWTRAAAQGACLSLLMLDVDHFKPYNDRYGHVQGDACLRTIGGILQDMADDACFVARFGGEEFAVLIAGADTHAARRAAERARRAVENLGITHLGSPFGRVTISAGLAAVVPPTGSRSSVLVEAADAALYASKRRRNCVTACDERMLAEAAPRWKAAS